MSLFEVTINGRPRSTVRVSGERQYEVDICLVWNNDIPLSQTPQKNGIEMVVADETTARQFMEDLKNALRNVELIQHDRARM